MEKLKNKSKFGVKKKKKPTNCTIIDKSRVDNHKGMRGSLCLIEKPTEM